MTRIQSDPVELRRTVDCIEADRAAKEPCSSWMPDTVERCGKLIVALHDTELAGLDDPGETSLWWWHHQAGKRSLVLDLAHRSGKDDLTELEMQLRELGAQVDTGAQDKQMQLSLLGSSDAVFQEVRPHFTDEELVNLTMAIVAINGWNRIAIAFRKLPGTYRAVVSAIPSGAEAAS